MLHERILTARDKNNLREHGMQYGADRGVSLTLFCLARWASVEVYLKEHCLTGAD